MNIIECYRLYMALRLHFYDKRYDFVRYNGKVKATPESFYKRRDKYRFDRLLKTYGENRMQGFFVANFVNGDKYGGLHDEGADDVYNNWQKRTQGLTYNFKKEVQDLVTSVDSFDELFTVEDGQNPVVLTKYYYGDVSPETFIIMNQVLDFITQFDNELEDDIMWPETRNLLNKYSRLLGVDTNKFRKILKNIAYNVI